MSIKNLFGGKNKADEAYDKEMAKDFFKTRFGFREDEDYSTANLYSRYWLRAIPEEKDKKSLIEMSSIRRAVARFVHIATRDKKIKVLFNVQDHSMTDSKNVFISANVTNKDFDTVVGLALHESSHILYSEFLKTGTINVTPSITALAATKNITNKEELEKLFFDYWNFIEDRRIDRIMMDKVIGYRPYYTSLYNRYWNAKIVALGLKSSYYRERNLESYHFRFYGLASDKSNIDLNALPGLDKISNIFDIDNIDRLESTSDSRIVAEKIFTVVLENIDPLPVDHPLNKPTETGDESQTKDSGDEKESGDSGDGGEESGDSGGGSGDSDKKDKDSDGSDKKDKDSGDSKDGDKKDDGDSKHDNPIDKLQDGDMVNVGDGTPQSGDELTKEQKKQLKKAIEEIKELVNGKVKKGAITKDEHEIINAMDASGTTVENVGGKKTKVGDGATGTESDSHGESKEGVQVVVIRELNDESMHLMRDSLFHNSNRKPSETYVNLGIRLGKMLANRLQIRNETKVTKLIRKQTGHLEKRLLHGLGYDLESVFSQVTKDTFGEAMLHISIDASSSMGGDKWNRTMTMVSALAYAATQVNNLKVMISLRWDYYVTNGMQAPTVLLAYDSRKDSFGKFRKYFSMMCSTGGTPEGLCFEATMKEILNSSVGKVSYFINISDGEPNSYNGIKDIETLTKEAVDKMRANGIRVMSFFVSDRVDTTSSSAVTFREMYGKDSRFIRVDQLVPLAKELNSLFSTIKRN